MNDDFVTAKEAARRLGITSTTLYAWLGLADYGLVVIRGQSTTVRYFQGGAKGQGRIEIEAAEIERLRELMRVVSQRPPIRRPHMPCEPYPGITVLLDRPTE